MSDFVATAYVSIQAELAKGFRASVREQVRKSIGQGITIPLKPEIGAFRGALQREARKTPILVPVKPDLKIGKFREEIAAKARQAAKGVTVSIPVEVATRTVGRATGGAGASGTTRQAGEETALANAIDRRAQAQGVLARAMRATLGPEQQIIELNRSIQRSESSIEALLLAEAAARRENKTEIAGQIAEQRKVIAGYAEEAIARRDALKIDVRQSRVTDQANAATARANQLLGVNISEIKSRDRLQAHSNELTSVEAELRRAANAARKAGLDDLARDTTALAENTAALEGNITAQRQNIGTQQKRTTGLKAAGRGGFATGLSALGARGATLAAGSEFLIGAAVATALTGAVKSAADLQSELNVLRVTAGATAGEMRNVQTESIKLGRDIRLPGVSASDAAQSMTQLVKAGLSVQDAIDGARGTLELATAAQIDFAEAGDLVASALNAFALRGTDAVHVADLLTNASNESQGEITDMGVALQQAAGAASAVGVGLDDTVALLTELSRTGLSGSDAGTSLRTAFIRLVNPTEKAAGVIKQLDLNIRDAQGHVRPEVFADFEEKTRGLTAAQRDAARAIIFGQDAFRASALLGRQGAAGLRETQEALQRQGAAADLAGARAVGLSGKISALQSNIETLGTTMGQFSLGPLSAVVEGIDDLVSTANQGALALHSLTGVVGDLSAPFRNLLPKEVRDQLNFIPDFAKDFLGPAAGFTFTAKQIQKVVGVFHDGSEQIKGDAHKTAQEVEGLLRAAGQGPLSPSTLNATVVQLDQMARKLAGGDAEAKRLAAAIRDIITEITKTQTLPPTTVDFDLKFDKGRIDQGASEVENQVIKHFREAGPLFQPIGSLWVDNLGIGMKEGVKKLDLGGGGLDLDVQTMLDHLSGDTDAELADLRRALTNTRRQRLRQQRLVSTGQRPDLQPELKATIAREQDLQDQITTILEDRKRDAKANAKDTAKNAKDTQNAQEKADQAVLDAFATRQQRATNKLTIAQATAGLGDDIQATKELRRIIIKERDSLRDRIKTLELRVQARQEYNQRLFELGQELAKLREERKKEIKEQIRRGIELDIEFAETTENASLERRNRLRLIKDLQKEADLLEKQKKLTIEQKNRLKEIRNEIAEQQKAIADLKGKQDERNKNIEAMFKQQFQFLQTISGFSANLIGNLIPFNASMGLVGGAGSGFGLGSPSDGGSSVSSGSSSVPGIPGFHDNENRGPRLPGSRRTPSSELTSATTAGEAQRDRGVSRVQGQTTNHLLRLILAQLHQLNRDMDHPEATHQRKKGAASFDYGYQGPGM